MTALFPRNDCDQAREAASARLDGELSELEIVRLESHLEGCESCRAVVLALAGTTTLIRETPSEAPRPFVLPSSRRPRRRSLSLQTAVAASALLAAASFSLGRALHPRSTSPEGTASTSTAAASDHLLALLPETRLSATHMVRLGRNLPV
jgi:predicted anti-sigma-YlaC factor YlaD